MIKIKLKFFKVFQVNLIYKKIIIYIDYEIKIKAYLNIFDIFYQINYNVFIIQ